MTTVFHARQYGRFIEIQSNFRGKKLHRMKEGSYFLTGSFSNRDNALAIEPQFNLEEMSTLALLMMIFP